MTENETLMYGYTKQQLEAYFDDSLTMKLSGPLMMAMSILSDAQELLVHNPELSRQYINRAKYIISNEMQKTEPSALIQNNDTDYTLKAGQYSCWIDVNNISINIVRTDKGTTVNLYKMGSENDDCIASAHA